MNNFGIKVSGSTKFYGLVPATKKEMRLTKTWF